MLNVKVIDCAGALPLGSDSVAWSMLCTSESELVDRSAGKHLGLDGTRVRSDIWELSSIDTCTLESSPAPEGARQTQMAGNINVVEVESGKLSDPGSLCTNRGTFKCTLKPCSDVEELPTSLPATLFGIQAR